jgi:16S rRNA (cytosine1402-N4)-methyltransferase
MSGPPISTPHASVMLAEVIEALEPAPGRLIVDGTFGAGGYSRAFLEAGADVLALDRDPSAERYAALLAKEFGPRFRWRLSRFSEMDQRLAEEGHELCDGVALDLGVSSMQLDEAGRGFSFLRDGPLDMRMGDEGPTAADIVNTEPAGELARIFRVYGEEHKAGRIAGALVRRRALQPFSRTLDLAEAVEQAVGGRRGAPIHPATRVFQALRIAVNQELAELEAALEAAERALKVGGRLAIVAFHSLEDRIVKSFLTDRAGKRPSGSRHLPPAAQGPAPTFELLFSGARAPSEAEVQANPRARSAKLRAAVRTAAPAWRKAA